MEQQIFDYCWGMLQAYHDKQPTLTITRDNQCLGWIEDEPITKSEARSLLRTWIHESLIKWGSVFLYTCGDNAHIAIETGPPTSEELSYLDTIIPNKFYHGDD